MVKADVVVVRQAGRNVPVPVMSIQLYTGPSGFMESE